MAWDFFDSRPLVGRKDYKCAECRRDLPKGTLHQYCAGKFEGEMQDYRLCLECELVTSAYNIAYDPDDGFPIGETRAELRDDGIADPVAWATKVHADLKAKRALTPPPSTPSEND